MSTLNNSMLSCLNQQVLAKNWDILQTIMDQWLDYMKMNFEYSQIQEWMLQILRAEKADEKIKSFV